MRKKLVLTALLLLLAGALAGFFILRTDSRDKRPEFLPRPQGNLPHESWTFAFYLAGDNSLENDQVKNLKEICEGAPALSGADIVVFFDRNDDTRRDNIFTTWRGCRAFNITGSYEESLKTPLTVDIPPSVDAGRFERSILKTLSDPGDKELIRKSYRKQGSRYVLTERKPGARALIRKILTDKAHYLLPLNGKEYANLDATDAGTLKRFVSFVKDNFVSDRYFLCMTGHSNGWPVEGITPPHHFRKRSPEFYRDFEGPSLRQALKEDPVDVLVLDTCSMADIETAWELRGCARYLVACQTPIPTMGLDYTLLLEKMGKLNALTPRDIACEAVEAYRDGYDGTQFRLSVSALDLGAGFNAFVEKFQELAGDPSHLTALKRTLEVARYAPSPTRGKHPMADLFPIAAALGDKNLMQQTSGRTFMVNHVSIHTNLAGLSIFLPASREVYLEYEKNYEATSFSRDFPHGWGLTLRQLFKAKLLQ